jgi:hypothetical protein
LKVNLGPYLTFGQATNFAVAADQSGRPSGAQHLPAMDGSSVPMTSREWQGCGAIKAAKTAARLGADATIIHEIGYSQN